ncbi:hypothetical protein HXZ94_07410 [Empedobacter falsenii]|uniref:hypothetical protein n=1 Tax=Empedobacter falsenii TaxID=343874 RepID=UPI002578A1D8|nr:hypothetical protein [Empedobacter falsenii]MDM1298328.1 hypothetical protein [Empedobacter falsenii]MDM1318115.1 hypothetical protein [Empedobacter falsenii]
MDYYIILTCKDCFHEEKIAITKIEAAFDLYDSKALWEKPCLSCSSVAKQSMTYSKSKLDKELMELWLKNDNYHFLEQDEELLLAEIENLELILFALDHENISENRELTLVETLCVLIYDNHANEEELSEDDKVKRKRNLEKVLPEVIKRKHLIEKHKDDILDYLYKVVEPLMK